MNFLEGIKIWELQIKFGVYVSRKKLWNSRGDLLMTEGPTNTTVWWTLLHLSLTFFVAILIRSALLNAIKKDQISRNTKNA